MREISLSSLINNKILELQKSFVYLQYINYRKLKTLKSQMLHNTNTSILLAGLKQNSVLAGCVDSIVAGGKGQPESDPMNTRMR